MTDVDRARRDSRNLSATWTPGAAVTAGGNGGAAPGGQFVAGAAVVVPADPAAAGAEVARADDRTRGLISDRERTHGVFRRNSEFAQDVKAMMRDQPNWNKMSSFQREALDMVAHKVARILHGDPDYLDHWDDISGYAQKTSQTLREDEA